MSLGFTEEQKYAIASLLASPGKLRRITGVAGAGSTFSPDAGRAALQNAALNIDGAVLSIAAKDSLGIAIPEKSN